MKIKNTTNIWAIEPSYLKHYENISWTIDTKKAEEIMEAVKKATSFKNIKGSIAVLPLKGLLDNQVTIETILFGTSYKEYGQWFDTALADASIGAIIIVVDSGGGNAIGAGELSEKIYKARGIKPIIAVGEDLMASAAYYVASAADEIIVLPSGFVGSVGTYTCHIDYSKALETMGVKYTFIQAGENKTELNPTQPISDSAKEYLQNQINEMYDKFVLDVARNRGISASKVKSTFGQGRLLNTRQALEVGMIDRIGTLEEVISNLQNKKEGISKVKSNINKATLEIEKRR